jgi:alpha-L-fucosidase
VDVSIRPSWYYHPEEDEKVHSLDRLLEIYHSSVGRNANLLLNFPVDRRGLIHEKDVEQVKKLARTLENDFRQNLASGKNATASNTRGDDRIYSAGNTVDGKKDTYWSADDDVCLASLSVDLGDEYTINRIIIQEYISLGQRVKEFSLDVMVDGKWTEIITGTTIGYKRILGFPDVKGSKVRLNIKNAKSCPLISSLEVFHAPGIDPGP